eukprot:c13168_g1_i1 orf=3-188(-)
MGPMTQQYSRTCLPIGSCPSGYSNFQTLFPKLLVRYKRWHNHAHPHGCAKRIHTLSFRQSPT